MDVEKREPSHTVSGNINWCSHCEKQYGGFFVFVFFFFKNYPTFYVGAKATERYKIKLQSQW